MIIDCQLFEPRSDSAKLFEPSDALLDHATAFVGLAIEPGVQRRFFILLVRNDRLDALIGQPVSHALHGVCFVAGKLLGATSTLFLLATTADAARHRASDHRLG